jgi:hypothetical protein
MRMCGLALMTACVFSVLMLPAGGQERPESGWHKGPAFESEDREPMAVLSVGAATAWNTAGGAAIYAPNFSVETTPVKRWLKVEAGITPFFTKDFTEVDTDLLFKKPWEVSKKAEFMLGAGPQWVSVKQGGQTTKFMAGEVTGDFMYWPGHGHRFGWYVQPAYDYSFAGDHAKTVGMTTGLLIAIR